MKEFKKFLVVLLALVVVVFGFVSCDDPVEGGNDRFKGSDIERVDMTVTIRIGTQSEPESYGSDDNIPDIACDEDAELIDVKVTAYYYDGTTKDVTSESKITYKRERLTDDIEISRDELFTKGGRYEISAQYGYWVPIVQIEKLKNPSVIDVYPISDKITLNITKNTWTYDEKSAIVTFKTHPKNETALTNYDRIICVSKTKYDNLSTPEEKENLINDYNETDYLTGDFYRDIPVGTYYVFVESLALECFSQPVEITVTKGTLTLVTTEFDFDSLRLPSYNYGSYNTQLGSISLGEAFEDIPDGFDNNYATFVDSSGKEYRSSATTMEFKWKNPDTQINSTDLDQRFPIVFTDLDGNYNDVDLEVGLQVKIYKGEIDMLDCFPGYTELDYEDAYEGYQLTCFLPNTDFKDFVTITRDGVEITPLFKNNCHYDTTAEPGQHTYVFSLKDKVNYVFYDRNDTKEKSSDDITKVYTLKAKN